MSRTEVEALRKAVETLGKVVQAPKINEPESEDMQAESEDRDAAGRTT